MGSDGRSVGATTTATTPILAHQPRTPMTGTVTPGAVDAGTPRACEPLRVGATSSGAADTYVRGCTTLGAHDGCTHDGAMQSDAEMSDAPMTAEHPGAAAAPPPWL